MKIKFIEKHQVWADQITNYWFTVDNVDYAISDGNGNFTLIDADERIIDDQPEIKKALIEEYQQYIAA